MQLQIKIEKIKDIVENICFLYRSSVYDLPVMNHTYSNMFNQSSGNNHNISFQFIRFFQETYLPDLNDEDKKEFLSYSKKTPNVGFFRDEERKDFLEYILNLESDAFGEYDDSNVIISFKDMNYINQIKEESESFISDVLRFYHSKLIRDEHRLNKHSFQYEKSDLFQKFQRWLKEKKDYKDNPVAIGFRSNCLHTWTS